MVHAAVLKNVVFHVKQFQEVKSVQKLIEYQVCDFKYDTNGEMMTHIGAMRTAGWELVKVTKITLKVQYKKVLP